MALSPSEVALIDKLHRALDENRAADERHLRYYQGLERIRHLGLAIPPDMRRFEVFANWCRVVVDTIVDRQQVRALVLPGDEQGDPRLRAMWDASNMSAHWKMFNRDRGVYGRAFLSVGANEDNSEHPLIRVESPREMVALVDVRHERAIAAARFYGVDDTTGHAPADVTLYLPDQTVWVAKSTVTGRWMETDRDRHRFGEVPVVMHLNRRMSSGMVGESQMTDVIPFVDAAGRAFTNMQFAVEAHGIPRVWMTGVARGDFIDRDGKPLPQWEAYYNAIHTLVDKEARIGQLSASDLQNFETAISLYGKQAATVAGMPARYFGLHSTNPPAEGAIRADEAQLIRSVESQNEEVGMTLGWAMGIAWRFAGNERVEGNRIRVDHFDPATPTVAQRMDAVSKAKAQGILSREGAWDELGWSDARKERERGYFEREMSDPTIQLANSLLNGNAAARDA